MAFPPSRVRNSTMHEAGMQSNILLDFLSRVQHEVLICDLCFFAFKVLQVSVTTYDHVIADGARRAFESGGWKGWACHSRYHRPRSSRAYAEHGPRPRLVTDLIVQANVEDRRESTAFATVIRE